MGDAPIAAHGADGIRKTSAASSNLSLPKNSSFVRPILVHLDDVVHLSRRSQSSVLQSLYSIGRNSQKIFLKFSDALLIGPALRRQAR
jgi:hypothetical protein